MSDSPASIRRYKSTMDATIVQMDSKLADVESNARYVVDTIKAHSKTSQLIVFPELALTGYNIGENDQL